MKKFKTKNFTAIVGKTFATFYWFNGRVTNFNGNSTNDVMLYAFEFMDIDTFSKMEYSFLKTIYAMYKKDFFA